METSSNLKIKNEGRTAFQIINDEAGSGYSCMKNGKRWEIVRLKRLQRGWGDNTSYVWKADWLNEDRHEFSSKNEATKYINNNL